MPHSVDLVIEDGQVVTPGGVVDGDVAIDQGKIISVGRQVPDAKTRVSAKGKWVMPGGVDPHAHIEQISGMGQWNADTFETATKSAAMGGTTSVISFAAQNKGQRLSETVADYAARARRGAMIDYAFHIMLTDTDVAGFDSDLATLIGDGHRSLKVFTTYNIQLTDAQLLQIFRQARHSGALVCVHAENDAIIAQARQELIDAGQVAPRFHAVSRPRMAEIEAVERICRFAEYTDQPVMLFHISTREGAAAIETARRRGAPVWAETCTHYLFMTEDILDKPGLDGAKWMCSPPQRSEQDQEALWSALLDGTLSLISSDHAPYRFDDTGKLSAGANPGFHQIANGLPGLETRLPLVFDAMVTRGRGGPEAFVALTSQAPARLYGLKQKGAIAEGMDADIVIWDPAKTVTYGADDLHDNVGYNPWDGYCVTGWPECVILRGQMLVKDGAFSGAPGDGKWIDRPELATSLREGVELGAPDISRPDLGSELAITFFYYRDLATAMAFYEDFLGLPLAIDQGWCKIYRICPGAHVGLVDETRGMNKWAAVKPVQLCIRVPDVDDWYAYAQAREVNNLSKLFQSDEIGIRAFVFNDPEGYQIEIQSATRPGA